MSLVSEVERAKGEWEKAWKGRVNFSISFDMSRVNKEKAWDYAFGLIKVDGLKPTDDFVEMAKKEIREELTLADIEKSLNVKYKMK
jgi:hypothetical protein